MWTLSASSEITENVQSLIAQSYNVFMKREDLGFLKLDYFQKSISDCEAAVSFFEDKEKIIVIGLGGSSLGAKALCQALYSEAHKEKIYFLDNVDAKSVDQLIESVMQPSKVGWILCSKSGSTIEVLSLFDYCKCAIEEKHNISIVENSLVVTEDKRSPLFDFALKYERPLLHISKDIGGRFSVFTPIGLFPLQFLNFNNQLAYSGFEKALKDKNMICNLSAQLFSSHQRGEDLFYSFQYSDRLSQWSLWLQQLWSESLGKATQRDGEAAPKVATLVPCRGASDQHSVLQQLIEGEGKKFACFHRVESSESGNYQIKESVFSEPLMERQSLGRLLQVEAESTQKSVQESQCNTMTLKTQELDEESLAYLMGVWMLSVGVLGEMFNINAFDQPGVESGKAIARRVLSRSR